MADDGDPVHSEERRAPVFGVVEYAQHFLEFHPRALPFGFAGEQLDREGRHGLVELEEDVADEAVADEYVAYAPDDLAALDVAHEVEVALLEEGERLERELVSLGRLLSDIEKPDPGRLDSHEVLRVDGAEGSELKEMMGLAVHIRARVEHECRGGSRGQKCADRRSCHARQRPEEDERGGHDRAGRTGAHEGIDFTFLLQPDPGDDRGVGPATDGLGRRVLGEDALRCVDHLDRPLPPAACRPQRFLDRDPVPDEDEREVVGLLLECEERPRNLAGGRSVRTHAVQRDTHRGGSLSGPLRRREGPDQPGWAGGRTMAEGSCASRRAC